MQQAISGPLVIHLTEDEEPKYWLLILGYRRYVNAAG